MLEIAKRCAVVGCHEPVIAIGLCNKHYKRQYRHDGSVDQTRATDWGKREKHSLYKQWCGIKRTWSADCDPRWLDFWGFVEDIGEKPDEDVRLFRRDKTKPWSKENVFWQEIQRGTTYSEKRREYMAAYQRRKRAADEDYRVDSDIKKMYGLPRGWYAGKVAEQNGLCAICGKPEQRIIKGRTIRLSVDHCHSTGKVRQLLCSFCNHMLGMVKDDPALLRAAADYLERHLKE